MDRFDDVVQEYSTRQFSVPAADLGGQTGQDLGQAGAWEAVELFDHAEVLDRRELAVLVWAHHRMVVYIGSTQTADGTVRGSIEISTSADRDIANGVDSGAGDIPDNEGDVVVEVSGSQTSDSDDLLGPNLVAVGFGPITDGTNGVGGSGAAGWAEWEGPVSVEPVFDDRDAIFANGVLEHANVSDAAIHADLEVWHTYGIMED